MQVKIVPAAEADVPEILQFISELAEFEKLGPEVVATEGSLRESLFGPRRHAEVLFVEEGPVRVGFAVFFHNYSTFRGAPGIYLEDLYIRPEWRRKGYGSQVFSYLARLAIERGCHRLEWWVLDWNQAAIDFYRSLGAEAMSEWTVQRVSGQALERLSAHGAD